MFLFSAGTNGGVLEGMIDKFYADIMVDCLNKLMDRFKFRHRQWAKIRA